MGGDFSPGSHCHLNSRLSIFIFQHAFFLTAAIILIFCCGEVYAGNTNAQADYWVFFRDKGQITHPDVVKAISDAEVKLTPESRKRRSRLNRAFLTDYQDIPVNPYYIKTLESNAGRRVRTVSRWLNACSIPLIEDKIDDIRNLPFVENISAVRSFARDEEEIPVRDLPRHPVRRDDHDLDYGNSYEQNAFMSVPDLHDQGLIGSGVLIGITDTGFDNLQHDCFSQLDIVAAWDFVNDDDNVADEDDIGDGEHGTATLSIIGGFDPGQLIGIAPRARYILAKTESTEWEREVEEDYWIEAIEWMDSLGVEVISVSLSYIDWYDYEDMDGNTALTTIVADRAAAVGMVVVSSIGNSGLRRYPQNKLGAPSDGDSIFAIGSVDYDSSASTFTSEGPTADGRVKPDFTTLGETVKFASSLGPSRYAAGSGTSYSAPAIAGLCAILIEANPHLTPMQIRDALRSSSHLADNPDTLRGWGIPDGVAAVNSVSLDESFIRINLHSGWNTVSHNLDIPGINNLNGLFEDMIQSSNLVCFKDGYGRFFLPEFNFNNVGKWSSTEGYQVYVERDDTLRITGIKSRFNAPIELDEGWHIIAYKPDFSLPSEVAFKSLIEQNVLVVAKDEAGRFFVPEFEFNDLSIMRPGKGYHIMLNGDGVLIYPRERALHRLP